MQAAILMIVNYVLAVIVLIVALIKVSVSKIMLKKSSFFRTAILHAM